MSAAEDTMNAALQARNQAADMIDALDTYTGKVEDDEVGGRDSVGALLVGSAIAQATLAQAQATLALIEAMKESG